LFVQTTLVKWTFIHASQAFKTPLYVSPFFNSTSMECPWDVFNKDNGNIVLLLLFCYVLLLLLL
tara:strand:- start:295 stop:486 length:192 start_codon:yes stop_codon:yes gene_type:complete